MIARLRASEGGPPFLFLLRETAEDGEGPSRLGVGLGRCAEASCALRSCVTRSAFRVGAAARIVGCEAGALSENKSVATYLHVCKQNTKLDVLYHLSLKLLLRDANYNSQHFA